MGDFNSVTSTDTAAEKQRKINEIPFEKLNLDHSKPNLAEQNSTNNKNPSRSEDDSQWKIRN